MYDRDHSIGTRHKADYLETYDTWQEFVDQAEKPTPDDYGARIPSSHEARTYGGDDWSGGHSWRDMVKMARSGWPEGVERIDKIRNAVFLKTGSLIRKDDIFMDVSGAAIDMGTYMTGQPECFMDWQETDTYAAGKGKVVRIVVNVCASGGVSAEVLFARGAMVVALADSLERAGRRAEIWVAMNSQGAEYRVCVKRPEQPLQLDQLALSVAHVGSFRRLGFAVMEKFPKTVRDSVGIAPSGGYGYPYSSEMEADITLPSAAYGDSQWTNTDKAVGWVLKNLAEQGIIVEGE